MRKEQAGYFNMAKAVIDHMGNHMDVWENNVLISNRYVTIKNLIEEVQNSLVRQSSGATRGYTEAKNHARESLEEQILSLGLKLRAFAKLNQDEVLLSHVKYLSPSVLYDMAFNDFITYANLIATHIEKYFPMLSDFQVTEEDLSMLQISLEEVPRLYAHRDQVMDERMALTAKLKDLFGKLRNEMKLLDDLLVAFIAEKEFLAVYMNSRRIHDLGRHTGKHEKQPNEPM